MHDIYGMLDRMQPAMERMQTFIGSPSFQGTIRQMERNMKALAPAIEKHRQFIAQFDFPLIIKMQKSFENIQTFYGLQFSTTIARKSENEKYSETHSFSCTTTISQAQHEQILSEKDYIITTQQEVIIKLRKENEGLKYHISYTSQDFKTKLSIQNSQNAKQKGYPHLKKFILEVAQRPYISTIHKNQKIKEITKIINNEIERHQDYNTIKSQISKATNLHNYIKETLKKQV